MKLAVSLGHGLSPTEVIGAAQKLESFGYDFVWVAESTGFDSLPVLGVVASRTERVGLGSGIVNVYSRSATQLAMAAKTLDEISRGRFVLGIGSSSAGVVERWHGLEFKGQLARVKEYTETLGLRLKGEPHSTPAPFSSARRVPVYLAAVGDSMLELAKRQGDGVLFFMRPRSDVEAKCGKLASSSFKVCANVVTCVARDAKVAEHRVRRTVAFYLTYGEPYRLLIQRLGSGEGTRETTMAVRKEWLRGRPDRASAKVTKELLDQVAIHGTPSECARTMEDYARIRGLHMLGLQFNAGERSVRDSVELLSSLPGRL